MNNQTQNYETIVIGGGQVGLVTGYFLKQQRRDFVILDANQQIGDSWRNRWDSLRLFTPARYDGLAGMPFPAPPDHFPTKDEMADYLEKYAAHFNLPVRTGIRVDRLTREGDRFVVQAGDLRYKAENVVVAMASFQEHHVPAFAHDLDPGIRQIHAANYRNPSQLQEGGVLIVGAGNSGAEIALEVAPEHQTWMSGRDTGHIPFRIESTAARLVLIRLVLRGLFHRLLTIDTPIGQKVRPRLISKGNMLVRTKPKDLAAAGVERVPRTTGVRNGLPLLEDGRTIDVANVIWCTGYHPGFSWIDLPIKGEKEPFHKRGVVPSQPGLYFVGLNFLYAASSTMIHGISRDAEYIVRQIVAHSPRKVAATLMRGRQEDRITY